MLRRLTAALAAGCAAALVTAAPALAGGGPGSALAGGGAGSVQCQGGGCDLSVTVPGQASVPAVPAAGQVSAQPQLCAVRGGPPNCRILDAGRGSLLALALAARSRLVLGTPVIASSPKPGAEQLAWMPTWLWLAGPWAPVTATAAVPGVSVTATAVPQRVIWNMGDGSAVTCAGPGVPFGPGDNPASPSPACGHTYQRGSAAAPGGAFTVTAQVIWNVTWSGAGTGGAFPGLVTTASVRMPVAQSLAIVTGTRP